jgi:phosphotriesterase-related protein
LGALAALEEAGMTSVQPKKRVIMTVRGPVEPERLGVTLPHEHVMVDFIGAEKTGPHRWNADAVSRVVLPHLLNARNAGVAGFVECTPMYLGRDVRLLKRLSDASGLHIITNTGLYKEPYLPPYALREDADALAARWIAEWTDGIEGTGMRPGFIKIAVNPGKLVEVQRKIVRAAARCSRATGLTIACHTGHGGAALECLEILQEERVRPERFVFVHADAEAEARFHVEVAKAGAWVEYDAIGWRPLADHVRLITAFLAQGYGERLLLSHDAGWFHVGEPNGGDFKPYTPIVKELLPMLEREAVGRMMLRTLTVDNPRRALEVML